MFKKFRKNEKGFTLAELLIVVAIIGVLVAISIPIFTSQLEKAREATDLANIRSAYAECSAAVLTGDSSVGVTYTAPAGTTAGSATKTVKLTQKDGGWVTKDPSCGGTKLEDTLAVVGKSVKVTVTDDGKAPKFESVEN